MHNLYIDRYRGRQRAPRECSLALSDEVAEPAPPVESDDRGAPFLPVRGGNLGLTEPADARYARTRSWEARPGDCGELLQPPHDRGDPLGGALDRLEQHPHVGLLDLFEHHL